MGDSPVRHYRRLRRLRRSARRWSVFGGTLAGAAAVLAPYHGIGLADAFWAAAAGGSVVLAGWRWADLRALAAQPPPTPADPEIAAHRARRRIESFVAVLPGGRDALGELRRQHARTRVRGSAVAAGWRRLDRASVALQGLAPALGGAGQTAVLEAAVAERGLRELGERIAAVERGMRFGSGTTDAVGQTHGALVAQFEQGVTAYEELVGAAASYVAEDGRSTLDHPAIDHLAEATELLRGVAAGFAELRRGPARPDDRAANGVPG
jgi:hypothetical protein